MRAPSLAATPLLAGLLWAGSLAVDPEPLAPGSVLLIATGLLALATVAMVGLTVTGGRWAHRTSLAAVSAMLLLAVSRPMDPFWVIALSATVFSAIAMLVPPLTGSVRRLPAASGPPARALLVPLILIGLPYALGMSAWDDPSAATLVIGLSAPVAALWFARVFPGGLYVVRVVWPLLALGLAFTLPLAPAIVSAVSAIAIAVMAWHPTVGVAYHPPREMGTVYPIPPELAPREVLDSAKLDEHGRPSR